MIVSAVPLWQATNYYFCQMKGTLFHLSDHCFSLSHALSPSPKMAWSIIYSLTASAGKVALGPWRPGYVCGLPWRRSWNYPSCHVVITCQQNCLFISLGLSPEAQSITSNRTLCSSFMPQWPQFQVFWDHLRMCLGLQFWAPREHNLGVHRQVFFN